MKSMKLNLLLSVVLSFTVLIAWDILILRPKRAENQKHVTRVSPSIQKRSSVEPVSTPHTLPMDSSAEKSGEELEFSFKNNKLTFDSYGAGIKKWATLEKTEIDLLLFPDHPEKSFSTFPHIPFEVKEKTPTKIIFTGKDENISVEKTLIFDQESHLHEMILSIKNTSGDTVQGTYNLGWGPGIASGEDINPKEDLGAQRVIAIKEGALHKVKKEKKGSFDWWGVDGLYFLAAIINDSKKEIHLTTTKFNKFPTATQKKTFVISAGQTHEEKVLFYVGPKRYESLRELDFGLEKSIKFGIFASIGKLIHKSVGFFYRQTNNYGWAIIIISVIIQILVLPLTMKSFRHTQRMKAIQPQLKKIQQLYKSDPKRLNVEMLNVYQKNGLKFMGMEGCFPMLIQMPVFIALYTTLRNSYELRHAPWIGWIHDLSAGDPYYILPILMGVGMLLQQKLTMPSADPNQAKIMMIMPVVFTFIFLKMPAGLVLYWFTNSLLSIVIQAYLMRRHAKDTP